MGDTLVPATEAEACEAIAAARAGGRTLAIEGGGSKRMIGLPVAADAVLSSAGLAGITAYNPAELVLTARAGTPMPAIMAALADGGQHLPFEVPDYGALLGTNAAQTIGGIAATNLSGPRRFVAGAARDSLLGVRFVNGRGEAVKSGGQVMKNVTGLDLVKLMAGSWGTLGLLTEVSFKVLPVAPTERTLVISGADGHEATALMARAMATSCEVSGAAFLPEAPAGRIPALAGLGAATLLRLEGFAGSIAERIARLRARLDTRLALAELDAEASNSAWAAIRDVAPFADGTRAPVWKISCAPSAGHRIIAAIEASREAEAFLDWQGGLVWLRFSGERPESALVRKALADHGGGHATLVRATETMRGQTDVFEPEAPAVSALTARIRASFDPDGVFNSGRRYRATARVAA